MNKDQIVYVVMGADSGGKSSNNILYASFDENKQVNFYDNAKNKNWFIKKKIIIDKEKEAKKLFSKLDGLERMILGINTIEDVVKR